MTPREIRERYLLEAVIARASIGVGFVNEDVCMLQLNETLAAIAGSTVADRRGKPVDEIDPHWWPDVGLLCRRVIETGEAVRDVDVATPPPLDSAEVCHWSVSFYPISLGDDTVGVGVVAVDVTTRTTEGDAAARDVSDLRSAENATRASEEHFPSLLQNSSNFVVNIRDVTEQMSAASILAGAERRFEVLFEQAGTGAVLADLNGVAARVNAALCNLLDRPAEQLIGHRSSEFAHPDDVPLLDGIRARLAAGHDTYASEQRYLRPDGTVVWAAVSTTVVRNSSDDPDYIAAQLQDITERKKIEMDLLHQAFHDPLTGLANRALLTDRLVHGLAIARRRKSRVGVMFLDIDNFKVVNDSLGHDVGDELLKRAGELIAEAIRPGDTLARFGGDEFVVVCDDVSVFQLGLIANRVLDALAQPYELAHENVAVTATASAGLAVGGAQATPEGLLRDADAAMYRAKSHGGGRAEVFDDEMRSGAELRLTTTSALRRALEREEFTVHYQPVVDLSSGAMVSAEALVRWEHPEGHVVGPDDFIPLAEDTGLVIPIGAWVLEQACRQLVDWRRTDPSMSVAVNLSVCQVVAPGVAQLVEDILRRTGAPGEGLYLELTESLFFEDIAYFERVLVDLKALGPRLSIDDFGTGYSSLNRIKRFPSTRSRLTEPSCTVSARTLTTPGLSLPFSPWRRRLTSR